MSVQRGIARQMKLDTSVARLGLTALRSRTNETKPAVECCGILLASDSAKKDGFWIVVLFVRAQFAAFLSMIFIIMNA